MGRPILHTEVGHGEALNAPPLEILMAPPFEAVFAEHSRFVWRLLTRLGVQERDAADIGKVNGGDRMPEPRGVHVVTDRRSGCGIIA